MGFFRKEPTMVERRRRKEPIMVENKQQNGKYKQR
jgi:hypothetical protein